MSKPLTLTNWQAKHLQQHGKLTLLVPMVPQPKTGIVRIEHNAGCLWLGYDDIKPLGHQQEFISPYHKGDVIECKTPAYIRSGVVVPDDSAPCMTTWFFDTLTLTADPEPMDVLEISEELAEETGIKPAVTDTDTGFGDLYEYGGPLIYTYEQTHGTDKPWAWIYRLESE